MNALSKRALAVMALILLVATATTAGTALAGSKKTVILTSEQVSDQIEQSSLAILRAKIRYIKIMPKRPVSPVHISAR
jgi:hypothetical protein